MKSTITALLALYGIAGLASGQVGDTLYGAEVLTDELLVIGKVTGSKMVVGPMAPVDPGWAMNGLAWDSDAGELFGSHVGEGRIYSIDTGSGLATAVGGGGGSIGNGLAYSAVDQLLYTIFSGDLFAVDPVTGAEQQVATVFGTPFAAFEGLAYDPCSDTLYGLNDFDETVYAINPFTGEATALANALPASGNWRGLAFDPNEGVLWATLVGPPNPFGGVSNLYRVDPATGVGTAVGNPSDFIQGLAIEWTKPTSVPVRARVVPIGGGPAAEQVIGAIDLFELPNSFLEGHFSFDPSYGYLDDCFDFRWVNVLRRSVSDGVENTEDPVVGLLPAIDPAVSFDPEPYYYTTDEWATETGPGQIHHEGVSTFFEDGRSDPFPPRTVLFFETFLVADDVSDTSFPDKSLYVLDGFRWTYSSETDDAVVCGPAPADAPLVNGAFVSGLIAGHAGSPGFPGWNAPDGLVLGAPLPLCGDTEAVSVGQGGTQALYLAAGGSLGGLTHLVLGSLSGTAPGIPVDGLLLPLVLDDYLLFSLGNPNQAPLTGSLDVLDPGGESLTLFDLPAGSPPGLVGMSAHHAYAVIDLSGSVQVVFTSNPIEVRLIP